MRYPSWGCCSDQLEQNTTDPDAQWEQLEQQLRPWATKLLKSLDAKRRELQQIDVTRFTKMWLLLVDSRGLGADKLTRDVALGLLLDPLRTHYTDGPDFDVIFVMSNRHLFIRHQERIQYDFCCHDN